MQSGKLLQSIVSALFIVVLCVLAGREAIAQKIGLLMDSYIIDRWYKDQEHFKKRIEELGGTCLVEVAFGDPHEQIKLAEKMIREGSDALVVVPCDALKASEIAKMAREANIPIISYDRLILSKDLSLYVSYDSEKVGRLQAEYAVKKVPKGNYILVNGPKSDNNAIQFRKGQLQALQKHIDAGDITIIGDYIMSDWNEIEALMKIDEHLMTEELQPDAIIAANDALANGSIEALRTQNLGGKVAVTGQDADITGIRNIIAGNQSMTIYKPIKPLAYIAAESAMKLAKKQPIDNLVKMKNGVIEVNAILLEPKVVDIGNYKETVIKDGQIKEKELE